jgi:hypothetical protein
MLEGRLGENVGLVGGGQSLTDQVAEPSTAREKKQFGERIKLKYIA